MVSASEEQKVQGSTLNLNRYVAAMMLKWVSVGL